MLAACERHGAPPDRYGGARPTDDTALPALTGELRQSWSIGDLIGEIGTSSGDSATTLFDVRNALLLAESTVVVAHRGGSDLRFFDLTGRLVARAGRQGGGPGEYEDLRWVAPWGGDSVVAYDNRHIRLSFYDSHARLGREVTIRLPRGTAGLFILGLFDDGSMLARSPLRWANNEQPLGAFRFHDRLYHIAPDGQASDSIGWAFGREVFNYVPREGTFAQRSPYFARNTWYQVAGDRYYVADNATYRVEMFAPNGAKLRTYGRRRENLRVTQEDVNDIRAAETERIAEWSPGGQERARRLYRSMPMPETMPAFGHVGNDGFHVDSHSNLWIREYNRPGDDVPRWLIFDSDNRYVSAISLPVGFAISTIGDRHIVGVWRDSLDLEYVQVYELIKHVQ